jgi:hypothetical protein
MSDEAVTDVAADGERQRRGLEERRLPDHAYAQRRAMLVMAAVTFAITWGGVRLSSIEALGLKISTWNERYLLGFAGVVLAYLIGNFATLVQPSIVAWRADFEAFNLKANEMMKTATAQMREGLAGIRTALFEAGASAESIDQVTGVATKFEATLDSKLPKYAKRYLELFRARLRFEYLVPVGISLIVLYLTIPRIYLLGS